MDDDDKKIRDLLSRATPVNDNDINTPQKGKGMDINIKISGNKTFFLSGSALVAIIAMLILAVFF